MKPCLNYLLAELGLDKFSNLPEPYSFIIKIGKVSIHRVVMRLT